LSEEEIVTAIQKYRGGIGGAMGPPSFGVLAAYLEHYGTKISKQGLIDKVRTLISAGRLVGLVLWKCEYCGYPNVSDATVTGLVCEVCEHWNPSATTNLSLIAPSLDVVDDGSTPDA